MLKLRQTITTINTLLTEYSVDFALIGGFALGHYGIHRATKDVDILIDGDNKEKVKELFKDNKFKLAFESNEVMQFSGAGLVDILLANRPLSLQMLNSAKTSEMMGIKIVSAEGIIGLKIQAYCNDSSRKLHDLSDIQKLLKVSTLNIEQVKTYADLFNEWSTIQGLIENA